MTPARFKHAIPASVRPQNRALERAATGIGPSISIIRFIKSMIIRLAGTTARAGDENFIRSCRRVAESVGGLKTNA